jgi:hypothetical protein
MLGMIALVLLIVYPRVSPYAQGKLLAIGGPAVVFCAFLLLAGARGRLVPPALLLAGGLAAAIWASDLLAYSHDRVAPTSRMQAIEQTGDHFRGEGLVLWNEFEEYSKYFARAARISVPFEAVTPQQVQLRKPTYFYGHYFDLDEEVLPFVEAYPLARGQPPARQLPAGLSEPLLPRLAPHVATADPEPSARAAPLFAVRHGRVSDAEGHGRGRSRRCGADRRAAAGADLVRTAVLARSHVRMGP